jgi:hypothetical protein
MNCLKNLRRRRRILQGTAYLLGALLSGVLVFQVVAAQGSRKPLTEKEVLDLLTNEVAPPRVAQLARQFGIAFQITYATEEQLRAAGATDSLIETLRKLAPKPEPALSAPATPPAVASPVLVIQSLPGDAHVYIDDEPVGTTSSEGRLKMSTLRAGEHHVRVAHAGYQDFEQTVKLDAGKTSVVTANLNATTHVRKAANPLSSGSTGGGSLTGFFNGTFQNTTLGRLGKGRLAIRESEGSLSGCLRIMRPMFGSGPFQGFVVGTDVSFRIISPFGTIEGSGQRSAEGFSGTYTAQIPNAPSQRGRFQFLRDTSAPPPQPEDLENCSTASSQDLRNGASGGAGRTVSFYVNHDHGGINNFCTGIMTIGNGYIEYTTTQPGHSFTRPFSEIKEVKKNAFYLAILQAFHISPKHGHTMNFVVVNSKGLAEPSEPLILAVARAMARN